MTDDTYEQVRDEVLKNAAETAARLKADNPDAEPEDRINESFINDCLRANERGDGLLYAYLFEERFVFDTISEEWYEWQGHYWKLDEFFHHANEVEAVAEVYGKAAARLAKPILDAMEAGDKDKIGKLRNLQRDYNKRASRLRSVRGVANCLKFAIKNNPMPLVISGNDFDLDPWLLGCVNGVIDLRNGKLTDGDPEDYITRVSPIAYDGLDAERPVWEKTVSEIFDNDTAMVEFMQRVLGYGITGDTSEAKIPICLGRGRNGKDTIVETVAKVLGNDLSGPVLSETLLEQQRKGPASGPNPEIVALKGLRLAFAAESDEGRRFSASKIKWLTGGNLLQGRGLFDKRATEFVPHFLLVLVTNYRPQAPAYDYAFWQRVLLIPFDIIFVDRKPEQDFERRMDKHLKDGLLDEASGILAWLVQGCLDWQRLDDLDPPPKVIDATAEYRRDEDLLIAFEEDCLDKNPEYVSEASELYDAFKKWFSENVSKRNILSQKKFGAMMKDRYQRRKVGTVKYYGIRLKPSAIYGMDD